MRIWKFRLKVQDRQDVDMQEGSKILTVQTQHNEPCLWAMVPVEGENVAKETRKIVMTGTGQEFDATDLEYLGSYQLNDGMFVGHVFEDVS